VGPGTNVRCKGVAYVDWWPWKWEVNSHGGGSGGDTDTYNMIGCDFPILLVEAYYRNSTKMKIWIFLLGCGINASAGEIHPTIDLCHNCTGDCSKHSFTLYPSLIPSDPQRGTFFLLS
jgi:hypothetical protein